MKKLFKRKKQEQFNNLSLDFITQDVITDEEYEASIDAVFIMFPSGKVGQRLEVFYKKKGAKYGEFHEIGTVIIEKGKFKIIQW